MIECCGLARLAAAEPDLARIYLDDNVEAFRRRTMSGKLFPKGHPASEEMKGLYQSSSELTHNNFRTLVVKHRLSYEKENGDPEFMSAVLFHDADDENLVFVVQRALYIALVSHRVLCMFTQTFELPDSVIHRRLEHFELDRLEAIKKFKKEFGA